MKETLKKNKNKIIFSLIICAVCIIFTTVLFSQFKTVEETDITGIDSAQEKELREMLSSWKTKYEETENKIIETDAIIDEYRSKSSSDEESMETLKLEKEDTDMLVGKTDVEGEGVVVTLTDNNEFDITADDLLVLVNELKLAGAEAISINDKRVVSMSEIVDVGGTILINTDRIVSPYVVKAIGDQKYLSSALSLKGSGYLDSYTNLGKSVSLSEEKNVTILAYNSRKNQMELEYAKEDKE